MKHGRDRKEMRRSGRDHHAELSRKEPDRKASAIFHQQVYQAANLVRAQGEQMERKTAEQWLTERCGIGEVRSNEAEAPE